MATEPRERTDAERWEREVYARTPERDAPFETMSGVPIKPLYTDADLLGDVDEAIGLPGEPPFTRGVYPSAVPKPANCRIVQSRPRYIEG